MCVWERCTIHSACAWEREMPGDLAREWGKRCVHAKRQSDRDLYWGLYFRRERGVNVLVCSCLGESMTSLCLWGRGGGFR